MKFRVNADLFRIVAAAVSTEKTYYHLRGVHIEPHPVRGVVMVATDGHRLLCAHDEDGSVDGACIVPAPRDLLKASKRSRNANRSVIFDCSDGFVRFVDHNDQVTGSMALEPIDGSFPDWRRILPAAPADWIALASFAPHVLAGMAQACADLKSCDMGGVNMAFGAVDAVSPALVIFKDAPCFGVMMPMRNGAELKRPEWLDARPESIKEAAE